MYQKLSKLLCLLSLIFILTGCGQRYVDLVIEQTSSSLSVSSKQFKHIFVHVSGAVMNEGMVMVDEGARVFDCVQAAGGLLEDADIGSINMAMKVKDELHIQVGFIGESSSQSDKISINEADQETLMRLPGIGKSKAKAIEDYRKKVGRFHSLEELMQIEGIKEGLFLKIKDKITL